MNVSEIIARVKRVFGDESGVQVVDEDVIDWINDAQRQIAASAELLQTRAVSDLKQGQLLYDTPDDLLNIRSIRVSGDRLKPISMQEADQMFFGWDQTSTQETGTPAVWWPWDGQVYLYPVPDGDVTDGISLYYTRQPAKVSTTTDIPELPERYHDHIVRYCMRIAYEMDENIQAANFSQSLLNQGLNSLSEDENRISDEFYSTITVRPEDQY